MLHKNKNSVASAWLRRGSLAALWWFCAPRLARAEDTLTYKFQTWQEDNQRVRVDAHYAQIEKDLGTDMHVKVMGLIDSIAGATPTGEKAQTPGDPVPLAHMEDRRKAWSADLNRQFHRVGVSAGFAVSRESDYVSKGWSLNTVTDFNQKNTNLLLGYGRTDDTIMERKLGWTVDRFKDGNDYIIGVTQLIDPNTAVTANLSYGQSRGFMSDPYKIVSTHLLDADPGTYYTPPENRPREKNKTTLFLGVNRNFEKLNSALDLSYRLYHDSFGITSHTVDLKWIQPIGEHFIIEPSIRHYRQCAADFYYYDLDAAHVITSYEPLLGETGTGRAPFYSSDYRLSNMETLDLGLKVTWKIKPWIAVDVAYNRYTSRGLDWITPDDVYSKANTFTIGLKLTR
ncbi:MAG: DUF3570 domain-containing protein [Opitutae bacterium]|nr:DUF3570 domain-containing protein [Opitutae bacterium]